MNQETAAIRPPQTLTDWATALLQERIMSGQLRSGDRLVEASIARELNISRAPVREALNRLRSEGLAREEPRRGWFVLSLTSDDAREVYDLRAALEALAARLVIRQNGRQAVKELRGILDRMREAARQDDHALVVQLDYEFHESLCRLSGNKRLHSLYVSLATPLRALLRLEEDRWGHSTHKIWREHEGLLRSLKSGDASRAVAMFRQHLEQARDRVLAYLQTRETDAPPRASQPGQPAKRVSRKKHPARR